MSDAFSNFTSGLTGPASGAVAITPHDDNDLANTTRALWIGTGGNVTAIMQSGGTVTFTNVADGTLLPVRCTRVLTSTTADNIVGMF